MRWPIKQPSGVGVWSRLGKQFNFGKLSTKIRLTEVI